MPPNLTSSVIDASSSTVIESPVLAFLVLLPLICGFVLMWAPRTNINRIRVSTLLYTIVIFGISLVAAYKFDWNASHDFQFPLTVSWVKYFGLNFKFGIDAISLWLVLLTTFLMPLVVLGSWNAVNERVREFHVWLMLLEAAMIGSFVARDLIFFYVSFEFTLIPMFFLIGVWGSSQRLRASKVFFLYTFTGSMLTFAGLIYVAWFNTTLDPANTQFGQTLEFGRWSFDIATLTAAAQQMSYSEQFYVLLALLAGFAVKVPVFPFHTWLPLAHTEAPTAGSVILAGVLLKLGTYGLLRFAIPMAPEAMAHLAPLIAVFAIIGILYTALICWVQKDIKKLIAYSSVSHLGFCVLGLMAFNSSGVDGAVIYMINHGLSTGAMFFCVGMIYERFHTREMKDLSGLARVMPIWASFMVFFVLASVGLPGLNGFVGEFLTLLGAFRAFHLGPVYAGVAGIGMIFSAIYLLYMLGRVVWGPVKYPHSDEAHGDAHGHGHHDALKDLGVREIAVLVPLALACIWLGFYPAPLLSSVDLPGKLASEQAQLEVMKLQMKHHREVEQVTDATHETSLKGAPAKVQLVSHTASPVTNSSTTAQPHAAPAGTVQAGEHAATGSEHQ